MSLIYTDGSCIDTYGGWACKIFFDNSEIFVVSGNAYNTTNNRMELTAVIEALQCVKDECEIRTDSMWVINCATGVWKRSKNLDLWEMFDKICDERGVVVKFQWVKAHVSGEENNNYVDILAKKEAKIIKKIKS